LPDGYPPFNAGRRCAGAWRPAQLGGETGRRGGDTLQPMPPVSALPKQIAAASNSAFGILAMTLQPSGYRYRFVPVAGARAAGCTRRAAATRSLRTAPGRVRSTRARAPATELHRNLSALPRAARVTAPIVQRITDAQSLFTVVTLAGRLRRSCVGHPWHELRPRLRRTDKKSVSAAPSSLTFVASKKYVAKRQSASRLG
jgi:hypothetical protein